MSEIKIAGPDKNWEEVREMMMDRAEREACSCSDHDEDCEDLPDKVNCWLYAPEKGMCPYLRSKLPRT